MSPRLFVVVALAACGGTDAPVAGKLALSTTTIDFGMVSIGVPATHNVVVSNRGDAPLTVSTATTTSAAFTVTAPALPAPLDPGETIKVAVAFLPTVVMATTDQLVVDSDVGSVTADLTGSGVHSVTLAWDASTSAGVIGYNVYRSEASGAFYMRINDSLVPETTYTDFTIEGCKTYYYVVTAVNEAALESGYSAEVSRAVPCF